MSYTTDRSWSDLKIPTIQRIVGPLLLEPADFLRDAEQATDLIMLHARDMRIAARVRRKGYAETYPHEFTLRSARRSGAKTELTKIVDGYGDWLFYGHSDDDAGPGISRWMVIDLNVFRANLIRHNSMRHIVYEQRHNRDAATSFVAFDVRSLTGKILVASSHVVAPFRSVAA